MATILDLASNTTIQTLVPKIEFYRRQFSPTWESIHQSPRKVSLDSVGKNWQVIWPFKTGVAGSLQFATMTGPNMNTVPGSAPYGFSRFSEVETYAGINECSAPNYSTRTVTLKKAKINFVLPIDLIRLSELGANVGNQVEDLIDGYAQNVALGMCNAWWGGNTQTSTLALGIVGSFTSLSSAENITSTGVVVPLTPFNVSTPNFAGSICRFLPGQAFDVLCATADGDTTNTTPTIHARQNTQGPVWVDAPDAFGAATNSEGNITLYSLDGPVDLVASKVYYLVPRNSHVYTTAGSPPVTSATAANIPTTLNSTLITTGTIHGINVAQFPINKSKIAALDGVVGETALLKYLARFQRARPANYQLTHLISTEGVLARMFQDYLTIGVGTAYNSFTTGPQRVHQGAPVQIDGGVAEKVSFQLFGRSYTISADPFCPQSTLYGLKLNGNWQIVRAPRMIGSRSHPKFYKEIEFFASLYGSSNNIFLPMNASDGSAAVTNFLQAPGDMPYELVPEVLPGLKLTGCTELYG